MPNSNNNNSNSNTPRTPRASPQTPRRNPIVVPETPIRIRANGTAIVGSPRRLNFPYELSPNTREAKRRLREAKQISEEQKKIIQELIDKHKNNNNKNNMNKTLNVNNSENFNIKLGNFNEPVYILSDAIYNGKVMRIYERSYLNQMLNSGKSFSLSPQTNFPFKREYVKSYPPTETNSDKIKKLHIDRSVFSKQRKQIIQFFGAELGGEWDYNVYHFFQHIEGKYKPYHFKFIEDMNKITKLNLHALFLYPTDRFIQLRGEQLIQYSLRRRFRPYIWDAPENTIIKIQKIIKKIEDISKRNNKTNDYYTFLLYILHQSLRGILLKSGSPMIPIRNHNRISRGARNLLNSRQFRGNNITSLL